MQKTETETNGGKTPPTTTPSTMTKDQNGHRQKGGESSCGGHNGNGGKFSAESFPGPPIPPEVDENVATGTIKVLQSSHVSEGPGRIANAPVPSVYVSYPQSYL